MQFLASHMDPVVALDSAFVPGSGLPCNVFVAVAYGFYSVYDPGDARNKGSKKFHDLKKRGRKHQFEAVFPDRTSGKGRAIPFITSHEGYRVLFEALTAGGYLSIAWHSMAWPCHDSIQTSWKQQDVYVAHM